MEDYPENNDELAYKMNFFGTVGGDKQSKKSGTVVSKIICRAFEEGTILSQVEQVFKLQSWTKSLRNFLLIYKFHTQHPPPPPTSSSVLVRH